MKTSKLHSQDGFDTALQACSPCEMSSYPDETHYWPEMCMARRHAADEADERLSICIRNSWPGVVLQDVRIIFLTATPNVCMPNGQDAVKLAPSRGIGFGDIHFAAGRSAACGIVRDIILLDRQPQERNRQFYAGVCFNAVYEDGRQVANHGYVLFKSACLPHVSA
ncbi:MAG: hypothetical protein KJ914_17145 [Gammaproteobacteria bacterium]|nr:hypothetical protein [Gammaproteobacteria bacterium]MBU1725548.1 hypothetical protein [Gammaproteobacteria bacterium]MBU2004868.1 hypothetical protein [Gammaproteobacteria bacterium]